MTQPHNARARHSLATALVGLVLSAALASAETPEEKRLHAAVKKSNELLAQGDSAGALREFQKAGDLAPRVYGADSEHTAKILHRLAYLHEMAGRYQEAEPLYLRSLEIKKAKLAAHDPSLLVTFDSLGLVY